MRTFLILAVITGSIALIALWQPTLGENAVRALDSTVVVVTKRVLGAFVHGAADEAGFLDALISPLPEFLAVVLLCEVVAGRSGDGIIFVLGLLMLLNSTSESDSVAARWLSAGSVVMCGSLLLPFVFRLPARPCVSSPPCT